MSHKFLEIKQCFFLLIIVLGVGCRRVGLTPQPASPVNVPIMVAQSQLNQPTTCSNGFVTHPLDFTLATHTPLQPFEANGAGIAINDLNGDARPELVFANLNGPAAIFWNKGNLNFSQETIPNDNSRAVAIVDVNSDGRLDIVFTHPDAPLSWWAATGRNWHTGYPIFQRQPLPGINEPAYSMVWNDLNGDGQLDLVTGSYQPELNSLPDTLFPAGQERGVFYYEQQNGHFTSQQLVDRANALAIALLDLNSDDRLDIVVGNDFDMPDQVWLGQADGWQVAAPFDTISHSTMSFDWGDIDNNGRPELFSTDMTPYNDDPQTQAAWQPLMAAMAQEAMVGDIQVMENVLQMEAAGTYHNQAGPAGLTATGWSWSGKFGDLDQDGLVDLYVVNGMVDAHLFAHLPGYELVEENQAFRNLGQGLFAPAGEWGLGSTAGGRGLSLADLDNDGDLDLVVSNVGSPALLFENQLCQGESLQVEVQWPAGGNTQAIGAYLRLHTNHGTYWRDVRATSGYLSADPGRVHFGFPAGTQLHFLEIIWPDGQTSQLTAPSPHTLLQISR